jgi:Cu/Ag efflux protein CusF
MSRMTIMMLACALVLSARTTALAQSKAIPGARQTTSATVEAVDVAARKITLRTAKGEMRTVAVPAEATRLAEMKVGDTVTATFYDNIVLRVKAAGEPDVDTRELDVTTPAGGAKPGGTVASQQTMTATIDAIDLNEPSISFKGPKDWAYRTRVQDKAALQQVKVGDRVDITWTEATLVSVTPGKQ